MIVAVVGCLHGRLNLAYEKIMELERQNNVKVDLVLVCGDFQAVRSEKDLDFLACPLKYRKMGDFPEYYLGKRKAHATTIFIGGNHEASNHLWEFYYGGWVAEDIYYLGHSGVVWFGGLRIAGISGIFKPHDYEKGYHEKYKHPDNAERSAYHIRRYEVEKLSLLKENIDVFVSHEWPQDISYFGDTAHLFKKKPFFRKDVFDGSLGCEPLKILLHRIQPKYWFSAHLHVKFFATMKKENCNPEYWNRFIKNRKHCAMGSCVPDIDIPKDIIVDGRKMNGKCTFLALDKVEKSRSSIQLIDIPENVHGFKTKRLFYDKEWLSIIKASHTHMSREKENTDTSVYKYMTESLVSSREFVEGRFSREEDLLVRQQFKNTQNNDNGNIYDLNAQTVDFCNMMGIEIDNLV